jgi:hypothetical protein
MVKRKGMGAQKWVNGVWSDCTHRWVNPWYWSPDCRTGGGGWRCSGPSSPPEKCRAI